MIVQLRGLIVIALVITGTRCAGTTGTGDHGPVFTLGPGPGASSSSGPAASIQHTFHVLISSPRLEDTDDLWLKGNPLPGLLSEYVSNRCFSTFYIFVVQSDLLKSWNLSCTGSSVVSTK